MKKKLKICAALIIGLSLLSLLIFVVVSIFVSILDEVNAGGSLPTLKLDFDLIMQVIMLILMQVRSSIFQLMVVVLAQRYLCLVK